MISVCDNPLMESEYFKKELVKISSISSKTARDFVIKHHYTHSLNLCKVAYGVFYKSDIEGEFTDDGMELIGVVVYSHPVGRSAASSFSDIVKTKDILELVRLVIKDGYGRNMESWTISQTFKLLKIEHPNVKLILSYSDEEQGHRGTIYQATGFLYQGNKSIALMPNFSISLTGPPDYNWIHSRTVQSRWGSHNIEHLKKSIGHTFWRKKESSKHRYFYILTDKVEKKKILKSLKHPTLPYPEKTEFIEEIEEIKVETVNENRFFT